eukprot:6581828-Alexandrium_andersonii.AAC.1
MLRRADTRSKICPCPSAPPTPAARATRPGPASPWPTGRHAEARCSNTDPCSTVAWPTALRRAQASRPR